MKKIIVFLLTAFMVFSCGSKKRIVTKKKRSKQKTTVVVKPKSTSGTTTHPETTEIPENANLNATEIYILKYNSIAMDEMRTSKIPASITLAQGILESGAGKGRLSVEANNHFGIKCHGWKGEKNLSRR